MRGSVPALSDATGVFSVAEESNCAAMFLCRRRAGLSPDTREAAVNGVLKTLSLLAAEGWKLSVGTMFGRDEPPCAYDTGFAHDVDVVGVFEAPDIRTALMGTSRLGVAGWDVLFATQWLLGPREFDPVPAPAGQDIDKPWGLFALWEWNDAWQAASGDERHEYDEECDIAFTADAAAGINIAGRHRLDAASSWHHLGIWESPSFEAIDTAMREHTRVADFKFTTSRHYIGRRLQIGQLLEGNHV